MTHHLLVNFKSLKNWLIAPKLRPTKEAASFLPAWPKLSAKFRLYKKVLTMSKKRLQKYTLHLLWNNQKDSNCLSMRSKRKLWHLSIRLGNLHWNSKNFATIFSNRPTKSNWDTMLWQITLGPKLKKFKFLRPKRLKLLNPALRRGTKNSRCYFCK